MKTKVIVTFLLCTVTASQSAISAVRRTPVDDEPPPVVMERVAADDAHVLADLLAISPVIPRGPRDLLRDYELEMASIAGRLSIDLEAISNAVGTGRVSRKQGEYVSGELCQTAIMQFQVFSALHAMLEQDLAQTQAVPTSSTPLRAGEMVLVTIPFSSLQLSPSLVEYLRLSPTQVRSIQRLMDQERPTTEPLMHELRIISAELSDATQKKPNGENEESAQRLAVRQSRLLKQLVRANSRLQQRIKDVLDPQQRKKLDYFRRASEVTVSEGN
jgi:Spy/CpxP family protein refolding chaperone